ncbi:MAG TPA: FUSC family protein [Candidatus Atopostipes pullistercoris]|uniref:FUSC family protein n=1 Tax=Candidatus Atopostipes pullistercoris TaxID=2838467 RepID=A0A9D2G078_9LACT|nr:FUSC family protein [Candidatus Atopostipes pullistercoris]
MINLKIGARTFKTSLAILLAMIIPRYIGLEDGVGLAAAAVIFSMMPSVQETFDKIGSRMISNIIGGIIAFLISNYIGDSSLLIAVASAVLIAILNQLNLGNMIGLSTLTTINVMLYPGSNILLTAIQRVAATLVGVLIAFFVNTFVLPPKYDVKFYQLTVSLTDNSTKYVRSMLRKNAQFPIMSEDLKQLNKDLRTLNKYHKYMMDPVYKRFISSKYYSLLRFLVVCRQSIKVNQILYEVAFIMHESENTINHLPKELRTLIRERMETLMTAHEQILLKWNGRVLPENVNFMKYKNDLRKSFMEAFYLEASTEEAMEYDFSKGNDLLRIMTTIFEYDKELQHFNKLTNSFVKYKRDDQIKYKYD